MALELRDALGALTATWSRLGHEIGFGIGTAHGFATLGTIGFEGRFDYVAIGMGGAIGEKPDAHASAGLMLPPKSRRAVP
jgi:adenylate cyclase